jgi:hypothetical protein
MAPLAALLLGLGVLCRVEGARAEQHAPPDPFESSDGAPVAASAADAKPATASDSLLAIEAGPILIVPSLEYRLRYRHFEGHDFMEGGVTDTLRHRARIGLEAGWAERVAVKVELQDVRTFGEEWDPSLDQTADGFDVHQAYASFVPVAPLEIRIGRQEIALENERLVGRKDFEEPGQSFDAIRFICAARGMRLETFFSMVRASAAALGYGDSSYSMRRHLFGGDLHYDFARDLRLALLGTMDLSELDEKQLDTVGVIVSGEVAQTFRYSAEGYYQAGAKNGAQGWQSDAIMQRVHYSAWLYAAGARLTFDVPTRPYLEANASFVSGRPEGAPNKWRTFEAPFGTTHGFYGEMDMFRDLASDTYEQGLADIGGSIGLGPIEGFAARATYHWFHTTAPYNDGIGTFGHELDLRAEYRFLKYASLDLVYAVFFPKDLWEHHVRGDTEPEHFVYSTADVTF